MSEPKIRFKSDNGNKYPDLNKMLISDVMVERHELSVLSKDLPQLSFTIENGVINPEDKKTNKRDFLMKDKSTKKFAVTEVDDIIYNPANIKFGAIHRNKLCRGGVSPIYAIFKPLVNPAYLELYVQRKAFINKAMRYLEGSVVKLMSLKPDDFLKLEINLPCEEEQQKIANFISNIDDIIAISEQEVKKFEEQKKGIIKKIFSHEIKFKSDDGSDYPDWEEKRLGNIGLFYNGLSGKTKEDFGKGDHKYITYTNVYKNTFSKNEINDLVQIKKTETQNIVNYGDVLFTQSSETVEEVGLASVYLFDDKPFLNSFCFGLKLNDKNVTYPNYLGYVMRIGSVRKQIMKEGQGISRINLSPNRIKNILIPFPCFEEQQKIANFLSDLDEAIELSKQELEQWKKLKKGLLQQMFI